MVDVLVVDGLRTNDGPPHDLAYRLAIETEHFVIVRRGAGLMRWDASTWETIMLSGVPFPTMTAVGFGVTRWGALRAMRSHEGRCR